MCRGTSGSRPRARLACIAYSWPGTIEAWDFDTATGNLSNHRVLATLTSDEGRPDGAAVDVAGNYWSAGPSAGCINCFSPQGKLLQKLAFPVPGPTMPCFAERSLYVTSLREGRSADALEHYPTLGGLFRTEAPVLGAPVALFADR